MRREVRALRTWERGEDRMALILSSPQGPAGSAGPRGYPGPRGVKVGDSSALARHGVEGEWGLGLSGNIQEHVYYFRAQQPKDSLTV